MPELLRAELGRPSWKRELVAFGTNTDPYQWAEGKYELMPPMIEALREPETPTSILTKSSLVTARSRRSISSWPRSPTSSVNFSVPTLDEKIWRETEPHTPHPRKRLEAVATFNEAGDSLRRAGRPADAGDQRLAGAGGGDRLVRRGGRGDLRQRHRTPPAPGGEGGLHVLALRGSTRSRSRATTGSTRAAPTRRTPSGSGSAPSSARPNLSHDPRYSRRARLGRRARSAPRRGTERRGRADEALLVRGRRLPLDRRWRRGGRPPVSIGSSRAAAGRR